MVKFARIYFRIGALLLVSVSSVMAQVPTRAIAELTRTALHPPTQVQGKTLIFLPQKENQIEKTRTRERRKKRTPLNRVQRAGLNRILAEANSFTDEILMSARDLRAPIRIPEIRVEFSSPDEVSIKRSSRALDSTPKFKDTLIIPKAKKEVDPRYLAPTSPYVKKKLSSATPDSKLNTRLKFHVQNKHITDEQGNRPILGLRENSDKVDVVLHRSEDKLKNKVRSQPTQSRLSNLRKTGTSQRKKSTKTSFRRVSEGLELVHHRTVQLNPLSDIKPNDPVLTEIRRTPAKFMDLPESVFQEGNPKAKDPEDFEPGYKYQAPGSSLESAKLPTFTRRLPVVKSRRSSRHQRERVMTSRKRVTTASRRKNRRPLVIF